jgi:hypothetical protein
MTTSVWASFVGASAPGEHPRGEAIALWLRDALATRGVRVIEVDNWRDVGWSIDVSIDGRGIYVVLSHVEGRDHGFWLLCCSSDVGVIGSLSGQVPTQQIRSLAKTVDAILQGESTLSAIRWYPNGWRGNLDDAWAEHP